MLGVEWVCRSGKKSTKRFDPFARSCVFVFVVAVVFNTETIMIKHMTESQMREAIEAIYSLSHFHEIREVKRVAHLAEVRGCVALSDVPGDNRTEAAGKAVDGFVYCIETYDLSGDVPEFCSLIVRDDPWLS